LELFLSFSEVLLSKVFFFVVVVVVFLYGNKAFSATRLHLRILQGFISICSLMKKDLGGHRDIYLIREEKS
jgi:hypothetical protein